MRRIALLLVSLVPLLFLGPPRVDAQQTLAGIRVVLDPGHGGDDWGVDPAGSGLREKEVVLEIVGRIQRDLEQRGAAVYVTRTSDQFVSLGARVRYSNALLFRPDNNTTQGRLLSIHLNSNRQNPTLQRIEVLVDPSADVPPFAVEMANTLEQATGGGFGYRDAGYPPGVHPGDLAPVRWTYPRGHNVLTESAFLSNPAQASQLRDEAFLDRIARAHVAALIRTLSAAGS
jgi:N-acetylmuramoyl-L-alanine amidase